MAYRNNKAEIVIEFKQKGVKAFEEIVENIDKSLYHLNDTLNKLEVKDKFKKQINTLNKEVESVYDKINKFKSKLESLKDVKLKNNIVSTLKNELLGIVKDVGKLDKEFEVFKQAIQQSEKAIKALIEANLQNYKQLATTKSEVLALERAYKRLLKAKDRTERKQNLISFNKELEDKINLLNFYKTQLEKINNLDISSKFKKQLTAPLETFYKKMKKGVLTTEELKQKMGELENKYKSFEKLLKKREDLLNKTLSLRVYGKTEKDIERLKKQIDGIIREWFKTGKIDGFEKLEKDLVEFEVQAKKTFENSKKYSDLYLKALENIHKASRLPFIDSTKIAQFQNEIQKLYDVAVKTGDAKPLALLNKEIKQIVNNSLGLVKASDTFERLEKELKKLGVSDTVLANFEKEFKKLAEESKSLGKTTYLGLLLKDMRELKKEVKDLSVVERKIKSINETLKVLRSYGVPSDTIRALKEEFKKLNEEVKKTADITPLKEFEQKINSIQISSKNLRELLFNDRAAFEKFMASIKGANVKEIKLFEGLYKDADKFIKELDRIKNKYMKVVQNLEIQKSSRKEFADSKAIKEAERLIEEYTSKIETLTDVQNKLKLSLRTGTFNTSIFANIKQNADEAVKQLNKLDITLAKVKATLQETSFSKFISHITKMALGYSALYMSIYEVINVIQRGFGFIVQMNEAVGKMSAVFDISASKAKQLEERLVRLGMAYGGDIESINEIAMALGRAGIESDKLIKVTEYVIKMSKLTGDQFETTANALITYIHNYQKAGVSIKQLADELTYMANASKLSTEDINVFSNYALATAKSANITRHFIEALAIAFSNAGFEASTIGTSIRRLGDLLQDNSEAVRQFFKSLGVNQKLFAQQVGKSAEDSERMMVWLVKKLKNMSDSEFQEAVGNMETLAKQTLSAIRNNADALLTHLKTLNDGVNGELEKSNVMLDTYIGKWERLKNSLGLAFNGLMQNALPILESIVNKTIEWVNTINNAMPQIQRDLSQIWSIIKGIAGVIGGVLIFKGVKSLVESFRMATLAGKNLLDIVKAIGGALTSVALIAMRNPYVLVATLALGAFGKLFFTIKNVNEELAKSNGLLAEQQKLNSLISQYDSLIAKKQQIKKQLAEALVNNDSQRIKLLGSELNKIEQQLEMYKKIINEQENLVKQKQEEVDKAQKYVEYQLLSAKLERLRSQYLKTNSKELENQIIVIEKQLEKLKEFANYKPKTNVAQTVSVFTPYKEQTPNVAQGVSNTTWEQNLIDFTTPIKQSEILNQKIKQIDTTLNSIRLDTNPFDMLTVNFGVFKDKVKRDVQEIKDETKKGLITLVTKEEVQRFQQLSEKIKFFLKNGLDVTDLVNNLNTELDNAFRETVKGLVDTMEVSFKQAKIDVNVLPESLAKEFIQFKTMLANATDPKEVVKLEAEFIRLKLLLDKTKNSLDKNTYQALKAYLEGLDKDFANLEGILKARLNALNSVANKANSTKKSLEVKWQDYQIKDIFNFKDFGEVEAEIQRLADKLRQAFSDLEKVKATGRMPIVNDLVEAQKEIQRLDGMYKTYYDQRVAKEKEYYALVAKIKRLKWTGYKDEEQKTQLLTKKRELESEIKGLYQKEEEYKKRTLQAEIKELEIRQRIKATIAEMNRETKAMQNPADALLLDIQNKMYENRRKLSIVSFDSEKDKEKLNAYFGNINAYIKTKAQELKQKEKEIKLGIVPGNVDSGTAGAVNAFNQYQQQIQAIKNFYAQKKALIQAQEQEILQELESKRITEAEAYKKLEALKTEIVKNEIEKRKALEKASFNASLSALSGYIGQFSGMLDQMMQAGLIKQKKWFAVYKAMRVAQAIIDTYASAQKAMTELPIPFNYVAAGLAVATGMMRVAIIKAQRFHTGGYVDRQTANQKMGGLKDDEIPAILQKGEYVLSKEEVKAIKASGNTSPQVNVTAPTPEVVILNSVDTKAFEDYLTSRSGRTIIRNVVGK